MGKKFVGPFDSDFRGLWLRNIGPSWPFWAYKSAFPNFRGNRSEF